MNTKWSFGIAVLVLLLGTSSCALFKKKPKVDKTVIVYPAPPDQARFQFLTKLTSSKDLGTTQSKFSKFILGSQRPSFLVKPYGLAMRKGKLFVCDNYAGGMEVLDLDKKKFIYFTPMGKGQMKVPINCYIDEKGYLYVGDCGRMEVLVYDQDGNFKRSFGEKEKFKPSDVCVAGDKVFVANSANSKIYVYRNDSTNKLLYTIPKDDGSATVPLCMPTNIAVANGKVYASDFGCSKIKVYGVDGEFKDTIGSAGDLPGQFAKIKGIAVDKEDNIFAVDAAFENVQIFNGKGQLLMMLGGHYNGPGGLYLPAKVIVDYDNLKYFQKFVDPAYDLKYLVLVSSQYGPDLINVYGRIEPRQK